MSSETVSDDRLADIVARLRLQFGTRQFLVTEETALEAANAIEALRSKPVASGTEVKPLEWVALEAARSDEDPRTEQTGDFEAETPFGTYLIEMGFGSDEYVWSLCFNGLSVDGVSDANDPEKLQSAAEADYRNRILSALLPKATAPVVSEEMKAEALRLLKAYDEREDKVQEIIEDLREIVLLMPAASRPDGLMKQAQAAVYAMRGRTRLMDDAAITAPLNAERPPITVTDSMVARAWTEYDANSGYSKPERFRAALEAAMKEA